MALCTLERMTQMGYRGHASVVLVVDKCGDTVLVHDPDWEDITWKLPGGKSVSGENPLQSGVRELEEETGITVQVSDLIPLNEEDRGNHDFYTNLALLNDCLCEMKEQGVVKERGDEGEIVKIFKLSDIYMMAEGHSPNRFLDSHYNPGRGGIKEKVEELLAEMPQAV